MNVQPLTGTGIHHAADVVADIRTRADAARHTNAPHITHVSLGPSGVAWAFHTWDGTSYVDQHFCRNACAAAFGRLMARLGMRRPLT